MQLPRLNPIQRDFNSSCFGNTLDVRRDLEESDSKVALLVTCSELGFEPDLLSGAQPGGMTIVQTVGGLVVAPGQEPHPSDAFGDRFSDPSIQHLIICGHSTCQIFDRLLQDIEGHKELLMFKFAEPALSRLQEDYSDRSASELNAILLQESLLQQAELIQQRPDVAQRLQDGSLRLHIWIRDDDTTKLAVYSPQEGQFLPQ